MGGKIGISQARPGGQSLATSAGLEMLDDGGGYLAVCPRGDPVSAPNAVALSGCLSNFLQQC